MIVKTAACFVAVVFLLGFGTYFNVKQHAETIKPDATEATLGVEIIEYTEPTEKANPIYLTNDETNLIALVTMAEAEGESTYGKRLVIDTIFNRIETEGFPNNVSDVIFQPNAFESVWNGRIDRCYVMDEIKNLVIEEAASRTNDKCVYFCACGYSDYGTPLFKVGNHYFSSV